MRRLGSIPCQVTAHAPFPEFPISAPAPLLPLHAAQPPPNPGIQCFENRAYFAKAKVVAPSHQIQSRFPDHPCQIDPPGTVGHLANPRLKPLERLRRNPPLRLTPGGKRESQKLPLPGPGHGALCPIDLELELTGEKPAPTLHPPFPRPLTLDVEVRVSRPWEPPPRSLAEPGVNLAAHPAPIIPPSAARLAASGQRAAALSAQCVRASALPAAYDVAASCISASPTGPGSGPRGARWDTWLTCKSARSR